MSDTAGTHQNRSQAYVAWLAWGTLYYRLQQANTGSDWQRSGAAMPVSVCDTLRSTGLGVIVGWMSAQTTHSRVFLSTLWTLSIYMYSNMYVLI